jgi:hypothetical protein
MEWAGTTLFYFNCSYSHNNVALHKDACFCNHLGHNLLNRGAKNVSNGRCKKKIRHALHTGRTFPAEGNDRLEQWFPPCAPRILTSSRQSVDNFL